MESTELPKELFINPKTDKRGKGILKKSINTRLTIEDFNQMQELLKATGISQSNFMRYAVKLGLADIENRLKRIDEK